MHEPVEASDAVVFIRIPFCVGEHKGDVFNARHAGKQARQDYLDALKRELEASADLLDGRRIRAIYVGGGIASAANPDKLSRTLLEFKRRIQPMRGMELTIRFAPRTVGSPSLSAFNICSFNRVALEVLATRDEFLDTIGAPQTTADIAQAIGYLGAFSMPNIDCELLYGIPGQTPTSLKNAAVTCTGGRGMVHVTLRPYVGPGSENVTEQQRQEQHAAAAEYLEGAGYTMYSPECFARKGFESEYVLGDAYGLDRIGFGLGARSFVDGMSYRNTGDFATYVAHSDDFSSITRDVAQWGYDDLAKRRASLGLSSNRGLSLDEFSQEFAQAAPRFDRLWGQLCREGLAVIEGSRLTPTTEGLRTAPRIRERIWSL